MGCPVAVLIFSHPDSQVNGLCIEAMVRASRIPKLLLGGLQGPENATGAYRSTVDTSELQHGPQLRPLKIDKNNFEGLTAQGVCQTLTKQCMQCNACLLVEPGL